MVGYEFGAVTGEDYLVDNEDIEGPELTVCLRSMFFLGYASFKRKQCISQLLKSLLSPLCMDLPSRTLGACAAPNHLN